MAINKKGIKIIQEGAVNYTFSKTGSTNIAREENVDTANKTTLSTEKEITRAHSIDLRTQKFDRKIG